MCVVYHVLNKITVKNSYPLPCIDDLLDQLNNVVYFTKLDLRSGYHQARTAKKDVWKTTFKTKQGLFEWMVMPFRLCNAPTTFMRVTNDLFRPFIDEFVLVYLDDMHVFSKSWVEHVCHEKKVLDVLKKDKLFVFQWGGRQQKSFETLKQKISTTPVLALLDLQRPFEIETYANDYAMGAVLMQQKKLICYHSENFSRAVINYPTYAKELYALVQSVKKWKHYLIGKETIIHMDH
eukprot:PITA_34634